MASKMGIPNKSKGILLLSKDQIDRMNAQLQEEQRKEEEFAAWNKKKNAMKEASQKLISAWGNAHKVGEEAQLLKDEGQKCRLDDLEAKYQQLRKKYVIDVANRKLYFETDRVKNLHAAMRLSEAISDRKEQICQRDNANRLFDELEKEYTRCMLDDVEDFNEEERIKEEEKKRTAEKNAKELQKQANVTFKLKEEEKLEDLREGRALWELADQYEEELQKEKEREAEKKNNYKLTLVEGIKKKMDIERNLEMLDEAEDVRNQLFNDAKLEMKKMCKEKVAEINSQKEEKKKRIADDLKKRATTREKDERRILRKAAKEKQAKDDKKFRKEEEKRRGAQKEIDDFYHNRIKEKKAAEIQDITDHLTERRQLDDDYLEKTKKEEKEENKRKEAKKSLQHMHLHQIAKKRLERQKAVQEDDYRGLVKSLYEEEDKFQEYAKMLIAKCEAKGLNTYPMKKAARPGVECGKGPLFTGKCNVRPRYFASVADPDELHYVKRSAPAVDTKRRLGFCGTK